MNKALYKITAWILIISGIVYAIINLYFSLGGTTIFDKLYELGFGLLSSVLIFVFSFFPGRQYLRISDGKPNKLTNLSLTLTIVGIILMVIAFFTMLTALYITRDAFALIIIFYGIIPSAFLYLIAVILLLINKFKK